MASVVTKFASEIMTGIPEFCITIYVGDISCSVTSISNSLSREAEQISTVAPIEMFSEFFFE